MWYERVTSLSHGTQINGILYTCKIMNSIIPRQMIDPEHIICSHDLETPCCERKKKKHKQHTCSAPIFTTSTPLRSQSTYANVKVALYSIDRSINQSIINSFCSLSYDRSIFSSKANASYSAI
jgi:hypothetical protein